MKKVNSLRYIPFLIIILLCIPVVLPYFNAGFFPSHDGEWAVVRLADMFRILKDLQFPARFSGTLNFGYGYPLFNFAYPFPYYLGILFYVLSHSFLLSIKTMFVLSVFFSGIFMYIASFELWKSRVAGLVSAVLYIYLPYRMVDLYVRGSLGESLSLVLFPLLFYFSLRLFKSSFVGLNIFFLSSLIGILITTHNIMAVLFLPVLMVFVLARIVQERKFKVLKLFIISLLLGLAISSFFWLPALFEKGNILLSVMPIADRNLYFVNLGQLLIPSWGYAPPVDSGGLSYQLGVAQSFVILISIIYIGFKIFKRASGVSPAIKYALTLILIWIICFLMLFPLSAFIWENLPLLKEINYPWTLLSQLGFLVSLLGGFLAISSKNGRRTIIALSILAIIIVYPYARPSIYTDFGETYFTTNEATTTSSREYMPLWVVEHPLERLKNKVEVISGTAGIKDLQYQSNRISFNYAAVDDSKLIINTIYYPGWKAFVGEKEEKLTYNNPKGVMELALKPGSNKVSVVLQETTLRMFADGISIVAFIILITLSIKWRKLKTS